MSNQSIYAGFERMWQHTSSAIGAKADKEEVVGVVYTKEDEGVDSSVSINADTLGGHPADDYATKAYVANAFIEADYPVDSINGKTGEVILTAEDVGAAKISTVFTIPYGQAVTLTFPNAEQNALIACRATQSNRYALFNYSGYGVGGSRSNVDRLCGSEAFTYAILPQSTDSNGLVIWNNSPEGGNAKCRVISALGHLPTITSGDSGATAVQYEYDNPPMELGVEYRTTERWNNKVVYAKTISYNPAAQIGATGTLTEINIPHGISNFNGGLIRWHGRVDQNGYVLPYLTSNGGMTTVTAAGVNDIILRIYNMTWAAGYTFYITLYYVKN